MIYNDFTEILSKCIKKSIADQTGLTKSTMTGLKTIPIFNKFCIYDKVI